MIGQRWVVLDPTYDLCFIRPDRTLASFADVHKDWGYYSRQVPYGYNPVYRYEDVRYFNWTKIPVLLPAIRSLISAMIGPQRTNEICVRAMFLNTFTVCLYVLLALYVPLLLITIRKVARRRSSFQFRSPPQSPHFRSSRSLPSHVTSMMSNS